MQEFNLKVRCFVQLKVCVNTGWHMALNGSFSSEARGVARNFVGLGAAEDWLAHWGCNFCITIKNLRGGGGGGA